MSDDDPKGVAVAHYKGKTYYGEDAEELERAAREGRAPRLKGAGMQKSKKADRKILGQKKALKSMEY
jgi:hypothetical protein